MARFIIKDKFILLNIDEKKTVNLYTLIKKGQKETLVAIGNKVNNIEILKEVEVTITLTTKNENFELKEIDNQTQRNKRIFVETVNYYIEDIKQITGE